MRIFFLLITYSLYGVQITHMACERFAHAAQISCVISSDAVLQYNPGFKVPLNTASLFKKKYFFCPHGTVSNTLKNMHFADSDWMVVIKNVSMPCPGVVIICAFDPAIIRFSWLKDTVNKRYIFYFYKHTVEMFSVHADQQYYAFNKDIFRKLC